ncbi:MULTISPECIES: N-acyl homoserine lactonase family protein [unclassified Mesobacillus]|uniref:N-acyl homoserine lactonase family protein n=1 Tax=unclassified Mesobacillus TaxID=2675270 RepID=UPI0020415148|nr:MULTISPECIES: N-acyl homoserine lactonase family protein [unclassified Mesobacillus]MCM3124387.1 N-acyl homoserine lactonase family protein [Mesobacillus sp. MER 33]MCM3234903.1 N-acyl homoserine lactonase family protein [Mesobacillus sp. MER 48]
MKVHIMHTGMVYIDRALAFKEKSLHPIPYSGWLRGESKKMWVPVSSYLIEHPNGLILVDTGWHDEIRTAQKRHLGRLASSMFKGDLPEGDSIAEKLEHMGIKSKDIDFVLLTHLHSDHVSGLRHVQDAKKILTSEIEWKAAHKRAGYIKSMWSGIPIETFQQKNIPYGPFNKGLDLYVDGSLYLVHTPGHSEGMFSVLVKSNNGWLLLVSDVGYAEKSWKEMILPGLTIDKKTAQKSLEWVKDFSSKTDTIRVIANHDPAIKQEIIEW